MKKLLVLLVFLALLAGILPISAQATTAKTEDDAVLTVKQHASYGSVNELEKKVDTNALKTYLFKAFYQCQPEIDLSSFNLSSSDLRMIGEFIADEMGECFHVGYTFRFSGGKLIVEYLMSASEYQQKYEELVYAKNQLLIGIKDNILLTDVEKALLIHDRLALVCEYDYEYNNYDCYNALVTGVAVCQGYAEAYDYLLEEVGIESYICESDELNHAWNIIYINNKPYHVDVTWDDVSWSNGERGVLGAVSHKNFLRSTSGMYDTGHTAFDYDAYPNDTTYDNYYWQRSETAFALVGNEIYYIDNASKKIKRVRDNTEICSVSGDWYASNGGIYSGNFSKLSTDGVDLFYSTAKAVYKYSLSTGAISEIFKPDISYNYHNIYGFTYKDGQLVCDINSDPPYRGGNALRQAKQVYFQVDVNQQKLNVNSNNIAEISSGGEIKSYTFTPTTSGTYVIYSIGNQDTYVELYDLSGLSIKSDDDSGEDSNFRLQYDFIAGNTYIISVKFYSAKITGKITFNFGKLYKISYNANGGTGDITSESADYGQTLILSSKIPTRKNYTFTGWSVNRSASTAECQPNDKVAVLNNITLYAVWRPNAEITKQPLSVTAQNGKTATVTVEAKGDGLTYSWYYKNKGDTKFYLTGSFKTNTYFVTMTDARNGRQLYCVVTDKYGNTAKTNIVTITMATPLQITKQPLSVTVQNGENVKVTVGATGDGLTYKWYYKNKGTKDFILTNTFSGNTYTAVMTDARNGRQIYCVVTDKYGNKVTTKTVTISMKTVAKIIKQPVSVAVKSGATAQVTVEAEGDGLTYSWYYKNKGDTKFYLTGSFKTNIYFVTMTDARNGRQLYCVVTDKYGNKVTTKTVTISMATPLQITKQPISVKVQNGETATVTFKAEGDGLTYKWYYRNKNTADFIVTNTFSGNTYTAVMNETRNGRELYCVITDKYGKTVKTNVVTITMAVPVKITKQPVSVTVANGKTATVLVEANGDGLKYSWYYKNKGDTKFYLTESFKTNTYSVTMTNARNGRQIYCVVTDKYGNKVTTKTVTINMK